MKWCHLLKEVVLAPARLTLGEFEVGAEQLWAAPLVFASRARLPFGRDTHLSRAHNIPRVKRCRSKPAPLCLTLRAQHTAESTCSLYVTFVRPFKGTTAQAWVPTVR